VQRLSTLLAILLLVLPAPVKGALAVLGCGVNDEVCCCAGEDEPEGPALERTCCCADDPKGAPEPSPSPERAPSEGGLELASPMLAATFVAPEGCSSFASTVRVLEVPPPPRAALHCVLRL